jgi:hypothetical protein
VPRRPAAVHREVMRAVHDVGRTASPTPRPAALSGGRVSIASVSRVAAGFSSTTERL